MFKLFTKKKNIAIFTLVLLSVSLTFYIFRQGNVKSKSNQTVIEEVAPLATPSQAELVTSHLIIATEDSQSAWDLLQSSKEVNFKEYDFGIFIEGINGLMSDESHFWSVYVNGESALVGVKDITLNKDDMIEFKYEEIE
jgi:hypothetical protein